MLQWYNVPPLIDQTFWSESSHSTSCPVKMDQNYVRILNRHTPQLQTDIQMGIILTSLQKDAGGFLTDLEYQDVKDQQTNLQKVEKMLTHLKGKENAAFFKFYHILQENGYAVVEKLKKDVGSDVPSSSETDAPTDTARVSATKS